MKIHIILFVSLLFACNIINAQNLSDKIYTDTIPFGGNAYTKLPAQITDEGLTNWSDASTITCIYFRVDVPQSFNISLQLNVPSGAGEISLSSGSTILKKQISNTQFSIVNMGRLTVEKAGYIKLDLKGLSKTGAVFANVSNLIIQYTKKDSGLVYVKNGSSFHFGRRGPSVHLNFMIPENMKQNVHWFYNEITIPVGMDKPGSYFMADGFGEGYFGMQVNSETERRILFSVWSPFETDNPHAIPDSLKIQLLKKGESVNTNNFGGEGSGGQSFMRFNWKAGNTYGFLLNAETDSLQHTTTYTAYFKDVNANRWYLIASFKRPQTVTHLTHLYSFLENFIPETGDETRMGLYKNQWVANDKGGWIELTEAKFTFDATAKAGYRKDYAGGVNADKFFLKNDGFFNEFVQPNQVFKRKASGAKPEINVSTLLQQ